MISDIKPDYCIDSIGDLLSKVRENESLTE